MSWQAAFVLHQGSFLACEHSQSYFIGLLEVVNSVRQWKRRLANCTLLKCHFFLSAASQSKHTFVLFRCCDLDTQFFSPCAFSTQAAVGYYNRSCGNNANYTVFVLHWAVASHPVKTGAVKHYRERENTGGETDVGSVERTFRRPPVIWHSSRCCRTGWDQECKSGGDLPGANTQWHQLWHVVGKGYSFKLVISRDGRFYESSQTEVEGCSNWHSNTSCV